MRPLFERSGMSSEKHVYNLYISIILQLEYYKEKMRKYVPRKDDEIETRLNISINALLEEESLLSRSKQIEEKKKDIALLLQYYHEILDEMMIELIEKYDIISLS